MLTDTTILLAHARANHYGVGAFNIYNLEGAAAVVQAGEEMNSPVILQLLPSALDLGGSPLIALCLEMAHQSSVPVTVHLDHCSDPSIIEFALASGVSSVMADGSSLDYEENIRFTSAMVGKAKKAGRTVEAELGKLTGEEDGLTVAQREGKLTDPQQAVDFVNRTGVSALAVCIGNVHGNCSNPPELDFARLAAIAEGVTLPLVLHGTSDLPDAMIHNTIQYGVCKFNCNTEIRRAYLQALKNGSAGTAKMELVELMYESIDAMKKVVKTKINLFCSANKASSITL